MPACSKLGCSYDVHAAAQKVMMQVAHASAPIRAVQLLPGRPQLLAISGESAALLDLRRGLAKVAEVQADAPLACCLADDTSAALGTEAGQVGASLTNENQGQM